MSKSVLVKAASGVKLSTVSLENKISTQHNPLRSVDREIKVLVGEVEKTLVSLDDSKNADLDYSLKLPFIWSNIMSRQSWINEIVDQVPSFNSIDHQHLRDIQQKIEQMRQEVILDIYSLYEMSCILYPSAGSSLDKVFANIFKALSVPVSLSASTENPRIVLPAPLRGDESIHSGDWPVLSKNPRVTSFVAPAREVDSVKKPPINRKRATASKRSTPYGGRLFSNPRRHSKRDPIPSSLPTASLLQPAVTSPDKDYRVYSPVSSFDFF